MRENDEIKAEIERLEDEILGCTDSGVQKWIRWRIELLKMKLLDGGERKGDDKP